MEDYPEFEEIQIGSVSCLGKEGVPVWGIIHYLEQTCLNHMKLTTVQRICELSARGIEDCRFSVAASSAEIFPSESLLDSTFKDYVVMADNEKSPDSFWKVISSYKRPVVFYNNGNRKIPLYDFTYPEAVRITSFTEQSPFQVDAKGAVGALIDLVTSTWRLINIALDATLLPVRKPPSPPITGENTINAIVDKVTGTHCFKDS